MKTPNSFYPFILIILFLLYITISPLVLAQAVSKTDVSSSTFVKWAKANAFPLQNAEPETGTVDLKPLKTLIGDARIVALGEAAHGFHAVLSLRNRMFRYMVEQLGFTTIVLEAGLAESHRVADYIMGGTGNVDDLAGDLTIGKPSAEDIELFKWMRAYNAKPEHKNKVKFYGMDMQIIGFPGDTTSTHTAIDHALSYLTRVDLASADLIFSSLNPFLGRLSVAKYPSLSRREHDQLSAALDDLVAIFERQRITFLTSGSKADYEWAYRNAIVARQTDRIARVTPPEIPGKIPPDGWKLMNARDAAMAENIKWIFEREGIESKILVYAHNAHIKNAVTKGGVWDALAVPPNGAGQYLRSEFGNKLVIIGTSFPSASPAPPQSLDIALSQVNIPRFLLDLRPAYRDTAVSAWLRVERPMQANMHSFFTLPVSTAFDALIFIDNPAGTQTSEKK